MERYNALTEIRPIVDQNYQAANVNLNKVPLNSLHHFIYGMQDNIYSHRLNDRIYGNDFYRNAAVVSVSDPGRPDHVQYFPTISSDREGFADPHSHAERLSGHDALTALTNEALLTPDQNLTALQRGLLAAHQGHPITRFTPQDFTRDFGNPNSFGIMSYNNSLRNGRAIVNLYTDYKPCNYNGINSCQTYVPSVYRNLNENNGTRANVYFGVNPTTTRDRETQTAQAFETRQELRRHHGRLMHQIARAKQNPFNDDPGYGEFISRKPFNSRNMDSVHIFDINGLGNEAGVTQADLWRPY